MKNLLNIIFLFLFVNVYSQQQVELCPSLETSFTYTSSAGLSGTYTWTYGNDTYIGNPVTISWVQEGTYQVRLDFVSDAGCVDSTFYTVNVIPCQETYMYVPNSFTPNDDGINDYFYPKGVNYNSLKMYIYNRWGEMLYETDNISNGWNGTYKGDLCKEDMYIYVIRWLTIENKQKQIIGHVILLK